MANAADHIDAAPDLRVFRDRIDAFLNATLPERLARAPRVGIALPVRMQMEWQSILHAHGLGAPSWPREHGGRGWSPRQMHVWFDACAKARAPRHLLQPISMIARILMQFGTPAQKADHLPGIISGSVMWCQGYSETVAGSDLATLKTSARRDGDTYRVSGQKIWTTFAHESDWMFALVRTASDGAPQHGISFLLLDMRSPGVTIRPIVSIDGLHHLNEVFFDNVVVPASNRIGDENQGWRYAKALLDHERLGICDPTELAARADALKRLVRDDASAWRLCESREGLLRHLAELQIQIAGLDAAYLKALSEIEAGHPPGASAAALKFQDTEITQRLNEIQLEAGGLSVLADQSAAFDPSSNYVPIGDPGLALAYAGYAFSRANSIAGGTSEVQKNIVWRGLAT